MKKITAIAACLLASLAVVGTASAQDHAAKANVPFGFYVADKWVPAGSYTLTSDSRSPNIIAVRSGDSKVALLSIGHPEDKQPGANKLVFRKYGEQYFLHEILCSTCRMNVAFSTTKRERRAEKLEASAGTPTDIYLALK